MSDPVVSPGFDSSAVFEEILPGEAVPMMVVVLGWSLEWALSFFFLIPPTSVASEGHTPSALKCATTWPAASWRAAFLDVCKEVREPKGVGWPSIEARQANRVPDW